MKQSTHTACLLAAVALLLLACFTEAFAAAIHHVSFAALAEHAGRRTTAHMYLALVVALSMSPVIAAAASELRRKRVSPVVAAIPVSVGLLVAGWMFVAAFTSVLVSGAVWWQRRNSVEKEVSG